MKNKLLYILLGILVSFSFINSVYADDITLSTVVENNTIASGGNASININLKSTVLLEKCEFEINSDNSILCDKPSSLGNWSASQNGNIITLTSTNTSNETLINGENAASLSCKINDAGDVILKNIKCINQESKEEYTLPEQKVTFTVTEPVKEDTTLRNLEVTKGGSLTSPFDPDSSNRMYMIILDSVNFGLELTANDSKYQDKIVVTDESGNVISDYGNITFNSPSGQATMSLTITVNEDTVYRLMVAYSLENLDNSVKSITVNGKELELFEGQLTYEYVVDKDVTVVEVDAVLNDSENFQFNTSEGYAPDSDGPAKFTIKDVVHVLIRIEPKVSGGASKEYYVKIIKEDTNVDDTTNKDKEEDKPNTSTGSGNNSGNNNNVNTNTNPGTGDVSMMVMAFILIASLVGSLIIYRKNLEGYK